MMLEELRKVIPSFVARVDRPDRGGRGASTSPRPGPRRPPSRRPALRRRRARAPPGGHPHRLRSRRRGQAPRRHLLPAHAAARRPGAGAACARLGADERVALLARVRGRARQPASPSRARRSSASTTASTCVADYGAFRDLQRHRMLTIEWQPLSHAARLRRARRGRGSRAARPRSTRRWRARPRCYDALREPVPGAGVVRGVARVPDPVRDADERARGDAPPRAAHDAVGPPGVPAGRARRCTGSSPSEAGHRSIAAAMSHVDHTTYELERLAAERAADARRSAADPVLITRLIQAPAGRVAGRDRKSFAPL